MRSLLLPAAAAVATLAVSAPAHAMGRYVTLELIGWNADGTAVLLSRTESSSGTVGVTHQVILVGSRDPKPFVVSFDDTQDSDSRAQKIDVATCRANTRALGKALAAHRFTGAQVFPSRCKSDRDVFSLRTQTRSAAIGDLTQRPPIDAREAKVEELLVGALGQLPADADVESLTGDVVLVLDGVNGDESGPAHASVIAATPAGPKALFGDLRDP